MDQGLGSWIAKVGRPGRKSPRLKD